MPEEVWQIAGKDKSEHPMRVLFLTNIPSPYRVNFFNELGKQCDLTVLFDREGYDTRDQSWKNYEFRTFRGIILKGVELGKYEKISGEICKYIKKGMYDAIIVANAASITGILSVAWMRFQNISYMMEGDGGYIGSGKGIKEWIKKWYISGAELCFSTSKAHDEYYMKYGARREVLCRYPFTSLWQEDILKKPLDREEKESVKKSLGIYEEHYIISVGSFIYRKGMDILIKACADIPDDWGIYIVGGTPTQEYLDLKDTMGLGQLHFVEFQLPEDLKKYYCAADLFALATREDIWGLVINEAMACGLPVITTNGCVAGVELIEDGVNGYIVPVEDVKELQRKLQIAMGDEGMRKQMAVSGLEKIEKYTFEQMADVHMKFVGAERATGDEADRS